MELSGRDTSLLSPAAGREILKLCRYVHHVMGVCCIVFLILMGWCQQFIFKQYFIISRFLRVLCYLNHFSVGWCPTRLWCNLLAGDLGRPSCLVLFISHVILTITGFCHNFRHRHGTPLIYLLVYHIYIALFKNKIMLKSALQSTIKYDT